MKYIALIALAMCGCSSVKPPVCEYELFLESYDIVRIETPDRVIIKKRPIYSCLPIKERYIEVPDTEI